MTIPQGQHLNKNKVWELIALPYLSGSRIALTVDKTIAHTKGYAKSQHWPYIPKMWCYCYYLYSLIKLARFERPR